MSSLWVIATRCGGAGLLLIAHTIAISYFGISDYGEVSSYVALANILAIFGVFGSKRLIQRKIAERIGVAPSIPTGTLYTCVKACACCATVVCGLLTVFYTFTHTFTLLHWCLYIYIVLSILIAISSGCLVGLAETFILSLNTQVLRPLVIIVVVYIFSELEIPARAEIYFLIVVFSTFCVLVLNSLRLNNFIYYDEDSPRVRDWLLEGRMYLVVSLSLVLQNNADIFMVEQLKNSEEAGLYSYLSRISSVVLLGLAAVNITYVRRFVRGWKVGDNKKLQAALARGGIIASGFALFAVVVVLLSMPLVNNTLQINGEWYGQTVLLILLITTVISAFIGPVVMLLNMSGEQSYAARILLMCSVLNIGINIFLIPTYGALGAAVSTLISIAMWNIILAHAVYNKLGLSSGVFGIYSVYMVRD